MSSTHRQCSATIPKAIRNPDQAVRDEAATRTKSVGTKVSEEEFALLEERGRGAGMRLAEWVREALLSAPMASGPDSGEVAVGEILALRSLLLNLHFGAAKGEAIPEPEMRGLIERADEAKMERGSTKVVGAFSTSRKLTNFVHA